MEQGGIAALFDKAKDGWRLDNRRTVTPYYSLSPTPLREIEDKWKRKKYAIFIFQQKRVPLIQPLVRHDGPEGLCLFPTDIFTELVTA